MSPPRSAADGAAPRGRDRGRATRHRIVETAARLCLTGRVGDLSVAEIAREAGVYPNQITHHFGSKDSLLVHAAFLGLLRDARRVEAVGRRAPDAASFRRDVSRAVLAMPSLPSVARALAAAVSRPDLAPVVDVHLDLLFRQSERYARRLFATRGWSTGRPPGTEVRTFWSAALGAVLLARAGAGGTSADLDLAGTLTVHD